MARRTFDVVDIIEILVHWHAGRNNSEIAQSLGVDRKTVRKYVAAAEAAGMVAGGPPLSEAEWDARARAWFPELAVGEGTIAGSVQGMATATPTAIDPPAIAETFCSLMRTRDKTRVRIAEAQLRNARLSDLGGRHLRAASSGSRARLAWGTRHGRSRPPAASAAALAHRQLRRVCRSRSRRQVPALRTR
jgi:hypothetical protein